ncbi:hypothetical protein DMH88_16230, partial [Escherichia coli]|nr:hypothetical protein [Escherichia coli]
EISGILVRVPLTLQRKYPGHFSPHPMWQETEIAKASNVAAKAGETWAGGSMISRRAEGS